MNLAGFDCPKVCKKKILCLYSPTLKVHSTKTSGPLRFSELGKQPVSKNSVYLTREACSKITSLCAKFRREVGGLGKSFPKLLAHKIRPRNC